MTTSLYLAARIVAAYTPDALPVMQLASSAPGDSKAINRLIARQIKITDSVIYPYDKIPLNDILDSRSQPETVASTPGAATEAHTAQHAVDPLKPDTQCIVPGCGCRLSPRAEVEA